MTTSTKTLLAVFVGGAAGSLARLLVGLAVGQIPGLWWPLGTVSVNLVGSFLLGVVIGHGLHHVPAWAKLGITTGFFGAFTTLSAISLDVAMPIIRQGATGALVMIPYAVGSAIAGVVCAVIGLRLGARRSEAS